MSDAHRELPIVAESARSTTLAPEATAAPTMVSSAESAVPFVTARVPPQPSTPARPTTHLRVIALAGATILAVAVLAVPRHPSNPGTDNGAAGSQPEIAERPADSARSKALPAAPIASAVAPRPARTAAKALAPKAKRNRVAGPAASDAPIAAITSVADLSFKESAETKQPGSEAAAEHLSVSTLTGGTVPVTITGCLEVSVDRDDFRLTDTEGADAPRSRSWRTGFLKKRSAPVALVEPPDRSALQAQVGRRVAATGLLTSHDLRVNSLRVVGPACD
jgi:hypothetical protein